MYKSSNNFENNTYNISSNLGNYYNEKRTYNTEGSRNSYGRGGSQFGGSSPFGEGNPFGNRNPFGGGSQFGGGNIIDVIKKSFRNGNALTKIIYINIGVYLLVKVAEILFFLIGQKYGVDQIIINYLGVPADTQHLLIYPWTLITYMFTHVGLSHILFNMLWLYWFGKIFIEIYGNKKLWGIYIVGGIAGAVLYIIAYSTLPAFQDIKFASRAIGASGSIMAVVFAACISRPQYRINIFLIGSVKLINLALIMVIIDLFSISSGNAGGHIAHLGGALYGVIYALTSAKNSDSKNLFSGILGNIRKLFNSPSKVHFKYDQNTNVNYTSNEDEKSNKAKEDEINVILDKISENGYESLSAKEKKNTI